MGNIKIKHEKMVKSNKTGVFAKFSDITNETMQLLTDLLLKDAKLWKLFVQQFSQKWDNQDNGWRGEYWGKQMMGAVQVYEYNKDEELYAVLERTVCDIIEVYKKEGILSTYTDQAFGDWDLWCRKYVLMGLEYFYNICKSQTLKQEMLEVMKKHLDKIMETIGDGENQRSILQSGCNHPLLCGVNASSIIEAVMGLYKLTKEKRYLDFAEYIISEGGTSVGNIFELAYSSDLYPYQYPVRKGYEMISCFEGIIEYYRVTGDEKYKTMVTRFADKILERDFTIIGASGCQHEYFDCSKKTQFDFSHGEHEMQETCVTVSLLRFFSQLFALTGDIRYIDAIEKSYFNAYLGMVNSDRNMCNDLLPFDSYSPLINGRRGNGIGGYKNIDYGRFYGCCAAYGTAGIGVIPKVVLMESTDGVVFNMYPKGEITYNAEGGKIRFIIEGNYPYDNDIKISISCVEKLPLTISLRIPDWFESECVSVNGEQIVVRKGEYVCIQKEWCDGDMITLTSKEAIKEHLEEGVIYYTKGVIVLARDARIDGDVMQSKYQDDLLEKGYDSTQRCQFKTNCEYTFRANGLTLIDYSSAGKTWFYDSKLSIKVN